MLSVLPSLLVLFAFSSSFLGGSAFLAKTSPPSSYHTGTVKIPPRRIASPLMASSEIVDAPQNELLRSLASEDAQTQTKLTPEQALQYAAAIESLPLAPDLLEVDGGWRLLATISPEAISGDNVDFFDSNSWSNYISGTGPSPFQSLVTGSSRVSGLTQWLSPLSFDNVVEFALPFLGKGKLVLKADQEATEKNKRIFRFRRGFFILNFVWGSSITLPYPVPFALLGDRAVGWLDTTHYEPTTGFRAAVGNKGTKFIFQRRRTSDGGDAAADKMVELASAATSSEARHETDDEERANNAGLTKRAVLIFPQQFGGKPGDYDELAADLRARGHPVYLARLGALQWLSITKSAFSGAYWAGELEPSQALKFYMDAADAAAVRMQAEDPEREFSILSHSIGGWIARAWLGEVAPEKLRARCARFVSLGTPHAAPPESSIVASVDQTRGLLKYVNDRWPGAFYSDIEYTCVASRAVTGKLAFDGIDSLLGFVSYFALAGEGTTEGDGITPVSGALLENAEAVVLDDAFHADVLPNPVGGRNTRLLGCRWYGDYIDEWAHAL